MTEQRELCETGGNADSNTDPRHWFIARQDDVTGQWYVYNFTRGQRLLGDYGTTSEGGKVRANAAIKAIAYENPRFRADKRKGKPQRTKELIKE